MTWADTKVQGLHLYSSAGRGSLRDISERLKVYLETLMEEIKKVDKCSCCEGYGYVVQNHLIKF